MYRVKNEYLPFLVQKQTNKKHPLKSISELWATVSLPPIELSLNLMPESVNLKQQTKKESFFKEPPEFNGFYQWERLGVE